jgi:hypothetical protein
MPVFSPNPHDRRRADSAGIARRIGRAGVLLFCAAYLLATAWFAIRHVLGDSLSHPAAYFFTWDMFPGYATESSRRMIVGYTRDDRFVKLLPDESHRFRWGINDEVSRFDVDRNDVNFKTAIARSVRDYNREHRRAPVDKVLFVVQYWPSRFNLPDDLYRRAYGEPNPHRRYWQSYEVSIDKEGRVVDPPPERREGREP